MWRQAPSTVQAFQTAKRAGELPLTSFISVEVFDTRETWRTVLVGRHVSWATEPSGVSFTPMKRIGYRGSIAHASSRDRQPFRCTVPFAGGPSSSLLHRELSWLCHVDSGRRRACVAAVARGDVVTFYTAVSFRFALRIPRHCFARRSSPVDRTTQATVQLR